jgi:helicase
MEGVKEPIEKACADGTINIALDTVKKGKQALVFANTKRSAEKTAEEIGKKLKGKNEKLVALAEKIEKAVGSPTKQCRRLAATIRNGAAFHHAGLVAKQRELIEDAFRDGTIPIIASTPTLAAGLDMPAFRAILKDLRRYSRRGLQYIPVLEYLQMAGRAGRPNYDTTGEAIIITSNEIEKERVKDKFINGEVEPIYSKLAVEPVLRTYLLSLIAAGFLKSRKEIMDFFERTFWAHQFEDMVSLEITIENMLHQLEAWEFLISSGTRSEFVSATEIEEETYRVTVIGKRVAELYVDPLTAHYLIKCLRKATAEYTLPFSFLQMITYTLEMRPLLKVKAREWDDIQDFLEKNHELIVTREPSLYEPEYEDFVNSVKTALLFQDWIEETHEDMLLEKFGIRPGELKAKLDIAEWLLYSCTEFLKIMHFKELIPEINKLRVRLKHGAKEEILPLLRLKDIGRVRARKLFKNKIKDVKDIRTVPVTSLAQMIGKKVAINVKEQVGEKVDPDKVKVAPRKRKGQVSLGDFR